MPSPIHEHDTTQRKVTPMLYSNPNQQWFWWCRPGHTYYQATNVPTLPGGWKHRPPKEAARTERCHLGQDHPRGHQCECRHRVDGLSPTGRGLTWGIWSQLAKVDPDWRSPGKSLPHRSLNTRKGVAKFGRTAMGMSNEEVKDVINSSPRNRGIQFVAEAYRVSVNRNKQRQPTGAFILTFQATTLPLKIRLGCEHFDVDLYVPSPRRCFKCQKFGHHSRTCRVIEDLVTANNDAPTLMPPSVWTAKVHTWPRTGSVLGLWWRRLLCKYKQRAIAQLPKHMSKQSRHLPQPMIPMPQQQVQFRPLIQSTQLSNQSRTLQPNDGKQSEIVQVLKA